MENVLAAKAEIKKSKEAPRNERAYQAVGAVFGALAFFFLLKATALATTNRPFYGAPVAEAGLGAQVYHWFAGADPITRTLATAIRPRSDASTNATL